MTSEPEHSDALGGFHERRTQGVREERSTAGAVAGNRHADARAAGRGGRHLLSPAVPGHDRLNAIGRDQYRTRRHAGCLFYVTPATWRALIEDTKRHRVEPRPWEPPDQWAQLTAIPVAIERGPVDGWDWQLRYGDEVIEQWPPVDP